MVTFIIVFVGCQDCSANYEIERPQYMLQYKCENKKDLETYSYLTRLIQTFAKVKNVSFIQEDKHHLLEFASNKEAEHLYSILTKIEEKDFLFKDLSCSVEKNVCILFNLTNVHPELVVDIDKLMLNFTVSGFYKFTKTHKKQFDHDFYTGSGQLLFWGFANGNRTIELLKNELGVIGKRCDPENCEELKTKKLKEESKMYNVIAKAFRITVFKMIGVFFVLFSLFKIIYMCLEFVLYLIPYIPAN